MNRSLRATSAAPEDPRLAPACEQAAPGRTSGAGSHVGRYLLATFFSKMEVDERGCWLWRGGHSDDCYGVFRGTSAHRVAYVWFVGAIPEGFQVDHLCRFRGCVNPAHLEAVTAKANMERATTFALLGACRRGHALTGDNLGWMKNGAKGIRRMCITCRRLRQGRRKAS